MSSPQLPVAGLSFQTFALQLQPSNPFRGVDSGREGLLHSNRPEHSRQALPETECCAIRQKGVCLMARPDGRGSQELRTLRLTRGVMKYAEGSCLIEAGDTRVICTASVEERVPPFLKGTGTGWVTAEYGMLPRSCRQRTPREITKGAPGGRTMEIQRLIGRALRSVVQLESLGERTITIDCDVLQADGGTRTASITGGFVALAEALHWMRQKNLIKHLPLNDIVAAVSVGVVGGADLLDLCYDEDYQASVDMNVVMTGKGKFVEVQGTAEGLPFGRDRLNKLLDLAQVGLQQIFQIQRETLKDIL